MDGTDNRPTTPHSLRLKSPNRAGAVGGFSAFTFPQFLARPCLSGDDFPLCTARLLEWTEDRCALEVFAQLRRFFRCPPRDGCVPAIVKMSAAATPHPHYRPELDGLRAIAVLAVMVFHLHAAWLPGGFAGVDVFFVLSGFLVTSVILRGRAKGHFSYAQFYQRRIARIFPAYLTMAVVTLAAAGMTYSSWDFASTASAFSASLLSISNYYQLSLGNYFQLSPDSQPLLHCWSLSVEEQFYLIFPLLLALLFRTPPRARRPLLILILLASFAHSCRLTLSLPVPGFYLLTSRAWEMLAGSLLAFPGSNPSAFQRPPATTMPGWTAGFPGILASLGMGLVLLSFFVLNEHQPFPGWRALLPVLGTAAIIRGASGGWLHQLLSVRPMVLIGQMSYSLYLWHWPVYSIIDHSLPYQNPGVRLVLKIMFTVLGAGACHLLIEKPARRFFNLPRHRLTAFLLLGTALILFVPLGHRLSARHYLDASTTKSGILTFPSPGATRTLMLIGDSQGTMYGQLARDLATAHGLNLVILSKAGEDPLAFPSEPQSEL
ncbi:MAG: acyltransferase 3, partial [Verrucomicrobiales bacterium]|nr:acyltransferase 3 [Verrucomicrobiales bacterium]